VAAIVVEELAAYVRELDPRLRVEHQAVNSVK
jgi:hypothetical protein